MGLFTMAGTTLLNLFRKPATLMYPFKPRAYFPITRGHITIDFSRCIHCTICAKKCPTDAIAVDRPNKEWKIDHLRCIACGSCIDNCPRKCLQMNNVYRPPVCGSDEHHIIEVHRGA